MGPRNTKGRPYVHWARRDEQGQGFCPAVVPSDRIGSPCRQFDGVLGLFYWQARSWTLGSIAAERDVFPDEWVTGRPTNPTVITEAGRLQGIRGEVAGWGDRHHPRTRQGSRPWAVNVLERSIRLSGGVPGE